MTKHDELREQLIETLVGPDSGYIDEAARAPDLGETLGIAIQSDPQFKQKLAQAAADGVRRLMVSTSKSFGGVGTGWRLQLKLGLGNKKNIDKMKSLLASSFSRAVDDAFRSAGVKKEDEDFGVGDDE